MRVLPLILAWWFVCVGPALATCDPGETRVRIANAPSQTTAVRDRAVRGLVAAINRQMPGRACAILSSDPRAFAGSAALDALGEAADVVVPPVSIIARRVPAYRFFDLPFAFRDLRAVEAVSTDATGDLLVSAARAQALEPLGLFHEAMDQMAATRDLVVPADLLGAKIAVDGSVFGTRWMAEAGAPPQSFERAKLAAWLKDGRVTAMTGSWADIEALSGEASLASVLETNHRYRGYLAVAHAPWWRGLPAELATELAALVKTEVIKANAYTAARNHRAKESLLRSGIAVRSLTRDQWTQWLKRLAGTWAEAVAETGLTRLRERAAVLNAYP